MEKESEGIKYRLNPKELNKIDFPFYSEQARSAYYQPAEKALYLPIRFSFDSKKSNDEKVALKGQLVLPSSYPKMTAMSKIPTDKLMENMIYAYENKESLAMMPDINKRINAIAVSLYESLAYYGSDFIMCKTDYQYPSFMVKNGEVVGISTLTQFELNTNNELVVIMNDLKGPFLSMFNQEGDTAVSIIILDDEGELITSLQASVESIKGKHVRAVKQANKSISDKDLELCQDICDEYNGKFLLYFMQDDTSTEEEDDILANLGIS